MSNQIVTEFDVPATMRDGVVLRANIFRPAAHGAYPVVLTRTPYGKDFFSSSPILDAIRLARADYIVVIQDVRGRLGSDGEWATFQHEADDGYDSVEWAARLPGSTGKVGMYGSSYLGFTQWMSAKQSPPHLKAIMPVMTWADARDGVSWRGGAFELGLMAYWQLNAIGLDVLARRYKDAPKPELVKALHTLVHEIDRLRAEGYYGLPLKDLEPIKRLELAPEIAAEIFTQPYSRAYASPFSVYESYDQISVPSYNVGGWYDIFMQGTLQNFGALRRHGVSSEARHAKLLMGPWSHGNLGHVVGELDFGFAAQMAFMNLQTDMTGLTQRWFDYWLKGMDNGITHEPPVKLFIMGEGIWRDEHEWPLARTHYSNYYLHSRGHANTLNGDGTLSRTAPTSEPHDQYVYDPAEPVLTHGGALLLNPLYGPGVRDQRPIESRDDVLVYTTESLTHQVEVTGPITVKLWACSDARDTDFVARLVDVHPDGFAQNLTDGILRARYRNGDTPELLEPNRTYEFTIDLWATANVFKSGHRIRLDVSSSNFPRWDRNPNTGAPFGTDTTCQVARQTILHDAAHPSHVILPIIPR